MKTTHIASLRLHAQQIAATQLKTPQELVAHMGALQAQDYAMSKWAVGIRLPGATDAAIEAALDEGTILRTHVLRPTWHLVAAQDIYRMLELTAPNILRAMKTRDRELGLTEKLVDNCFGLLEKMLAKDRHLTREELMAELNANGIPANGQQAAHYMARAELEGLVCSGRMKGNKQTYALLSERVGKRKSVAKEQALEQLARTYFTSHAPATLADFTWWSGLSATDARNALEMIREKFVCITVDGADYYLPEDLRDTTPKKTSVFLLPAFDEFLISYRDRSASIAAELQPHAFTTNGIFRPTVTVNGQTTGTWKRTVKKETVHIEAHFFAPLASSLEPQLRKAAQAYGDFIGKKVQLIHNGGDS